MEKFSPKIVKYKVGKPVKFLEYVKSQKLEYLVKATSESTIIITPNTKYIYVHSSNFPRNKLFMFNNVRRDAVKWVEQNDNLAMPPKHKANKYNFDYDDSYGNIIGFDINHAYWRIAYQKGMISKKTYEAGLDPQCKALRLATISVLGRKLEYDKYDNGGKQEVVVVRDEDPRLKAVFKYVRFYCYQMMFNLSVMLKEDFDCWKTDCIYFRDTRENRTLVANYLDSKQMDYKVLEF